MSPGNVAAMLPEARPRALRFADSVDTSLRLLEVDEAILQEMLKDGVVIKGGQDDEAVLCTQTKTYALKYVETTNLQLLVAPEEELQLPDSSQADDDNDENMPVACVAAGLQTQLQQLGKSSALPPVTVSATTKAHIEVVEVAPRLATLQHLLARHAYGVEDEQSCREDEDMDGYAGDQPTASGRQGYTFQELLDRVQASAAEIREALQRLDALEVNGRWRVVNEHYLTELLELLLLSAEEIGAPWHALPSSDLEASLSSTEYSPEVIRHCLSVYGRKLPRLVTGGSEGREGMEIEEGVSGVQDCSSSNGGGVWQLDYDKVCIHFAHKVLRGVPSTGLSLQEFERAWRDAMPHGFDAELNSLRGEVLMEARGSSGQVRVRPFSVRRLPTDPKARFTALFHLQARWERSELEPYLVGLKVPGQSAEALLLKYTRASQLTPEAPLMYCAR